jgi:hypothetical protein
MDLWYHVAHLDYERLLSEWRWLCASPMTIIARTAFADLYLRDRGGRIHWLDVAIGKLNLVAGSEAEFFELAGTPEKRDKCSQNLLSLRRMHMASNRMQISASPLAYRWSLRSPATPRTRMWETFTSTSRFWAICIIRSRIYLRVQKFDFTKDLRGKF